jgi:glycosyltransferase involved in cell wall biosynthesis
MTRISVIIPTLGRPTLHRAVSSVLHQLGPNDELIIVGDGPTPNIQWVIDHGDPRIRYGETNPTRSWGTAQYDFGMDLSEGDWCVFLPDDDWLPDGALDAVRRGVQGTTGVHVFACQCLHWGGRILRGSKNCCEVTANQIVVPAPFSHKGMLERVVTPEKMPRWADSKAQTFDHAYLTAMLKWYGQTDPHYHDEVICMADQQNNGRVF